jgi:hypothetical protein
MTAAGPPAGPRLRPLGVGGTLDAALGLYGGNVWALWQITAIVIVPLEILDVIITRASLPAGVVVRNGTLYSSSVTGAATASAATGELVVTVLSLIGILLATGALFQLLLDSYLGRPHRVAESLAYARHRLGSLLWLSIIVTVLVLVGLILFIVPGIYVLVSLSVALPVLMLEGLTGRAAASRAGRLVSGRWWATFGRLLIALILYGVVYVLIGSVGSGIASGTSSVTTFLIIQAAVAAVAYILLAPFWAAVVTVIYIDLRVRKEGLDARTLAARPRGPGGTVPELPGGGEFDPTPHR